MASASRECMTLKTRFREVRGKPVIHAKGAPSSPTLRRSSPGVRAQLFPDRSQVRQVAGIGGRRLRTALECGRIGDLLPKSGAHPHGRGGPNRHGRHVLQWAASTALPRARKAADFEQRLFQLRRNEGRPPIHREPVRPPLTCCSAEHYSERDRRRAVELFVPTHRAVTRSLQWHHRSGGGSPPGTTAMTSNIATRLSSRPLRAQSDA
jgi:hypothetical protein